MSRCFGERVRKQNTPDKHTYIHRLVTWNLCKGTDVKEWVLIELLNIHVIMLEYTPIIHYIIMQSYSFKKLFAFGSPSDLLRSE